MRNLCFIVFIFSQFTLYAFQGIVENTGFLKHPDGSMATEVIAFAAIPGGRVYFQQDRISYVFTEHANTSSDLHEKVKAQTPATAERIDMLFGNMQPGCASVFSGRLKEDVRFIKPEGEFTSGTYTRLAYTQVWKGIDIFFYADEKQGLKYDVLVQPGASVQDIAFVFSGASSIEIENDVLMIRGVLNTIQEKIPVCYQDWMQGNTKNRISYAGKYVLQNDTLSFNLPAYAKQLPLVIDPWATYVGTSDGEQAEDVVMDKAGNTYITGYTQSPVFPVTPGAFQSTSGGDYDAFIMKFDASGQGVWCTYYGGSGYDFGYQIKIDSKGNPFISGYTYSNDLFVSMGSFAGVFDTYILKLNANGAFKWARYFGGSGGEFTVGMGCCKTDKMVIAGFTSSQDIPVTPGAFQNTHAGALDIFIAVFDSSGNNLWATYYGGTATDDAHAANFDSKGNVLIGGESFSNDFPVSPGAYQPVNIGSSDVYVLKFDSLGNRLWGTLMGGTANEDINGIAADTAGFIYVSGFSQSSDFPIVGNAFQPLKKASRDAILIRFTPGGMPVWSTYFGGDSTDIARALTITPDRFILICGETYSGDFPIVGNAFQPTKSGGADVFYAAFDTSGTPLFSSYRGGNGLDVALGISCDTNYRVTICGLTYSNNFPVSPGAYQTSYSGNEDVFVWQIDSTQGVPVDTSKGTGDAIVKLQGAQMPLLYPNPSNGHIAFSADLLAIEIYSLQGQLLFSQTKPYTANSLLSVDFLPSGFYTVFIKGKEGTARYKLVQSK